MTNNRQQRMRLIGAAADNIVATKGISPSEVSGYAVSQAAFGKKPSGSFYLEFEEWLKQRQAVPGAPPIDMPAEAANELESWADHLKAEIMARVTGIVRGVAGSFEQTTSLRVVTLERLNADQSRRSKEILATLVETEAERDDLKERNLGLENQLQEQRNFSQRLLGRIEQLTGGSDSPPLAGGASFESAPPATATGMVEDAEPSAPTADGDEATGRSSVTPDVETGDDADVTPGAGIG